MRKLAVGVRPPSVTPVLAVAAGTVCALRPLKALDLHVYHAAAKSCFLQSGPMYGPNSELGWPMLYRYPPLFLCLFRPLAFLPLWAVAGIWAAAKVLLLGILIALWYRRHQAARPVRAHWIPALLMLPYVLQELQSGNVQLFLVEMLCFAILVCDQHELAAGGLIGLAAAIKVWPAFIVPFFAVRRRWRLAVTSSAAGGLFTLIPGFWLGWRNLFHLLLQWYSQEKQVNALLGDRWYPSQSLRGVMLRYLTNMDYSGLPDPNYPLVNFVSLPSWEVRQFWLVLAIVLGAVALYWARRCGDDAGACAVFFCFLLIIQPNVHRTMYVALLWPVLYTSVLLTDQGTSRILRLPLLIATAVAVLEPLIPGASSQRLAQVLGVDFLGILLPVTVAILWATHDARLGNSGPVAAMTEASDAAVLEDWRDEVVRTEGRKDNP